jgi:hypothetical protein
MKRAGVLLLVTALALGQSPAAMANWLTNALEHAGDAGKGVARGVVGLEQDLGRAVAHIKSLPERSGSAVLAAQAGQEGHWRFVNAKGESYTAANATELASVRATLLPGTTGQLSVYLTPDTVFEQHALLKDLPADANLQIATRSGAYPVIRRNSGDRDLLFAEVRPNLHVRLDNEDIFAETLFQLGQPLKPSNVRVLALESGSLDALTSVPRFDVATRTALVDTIDPARLAASFGRVRGQTVVLTGRIDGGSLVFLDAGGGAGRLPLDDVRKAARVADINLVIVKTENPRQPGGKNWLWQTATIPGLDQAVKQPLFGDFLSAISPQASPLTISGYRDSGHRIVLDVLPSGSSVPLTDTVAGWFDTIAGEAMGRIATTGFEADLNDEQRQRDLDLRIFPGLPSSVQFGYLLLVAMGLFGLRTAWTLWARVWPPEDRSEYASTWGYGVARAVRGLLFALMFLPLVGLPMFVRYLGLQVWTLLTAPIRALRWLREWLVPRPG